SSSQLSTRVYLLSLHDALPISRLVLRAVLGGPGEHVGLLVRGVQLDLVDGGHDARVLHDAVEVLGQVVRDADRRRKPRVADLDEDRKSTRLNSSHVKISYAVFF